MVYEKNSTKNIDSLCKQLGYNRGEYLELDDNVPSAIPNVYKSSNLYTFSNNKFVSVPGDKNSYLLVDKFTCHSVPRSTDSLFSIQPKINKLNSTIDFF